MWNLIVDHFREYMGSGLVFIYYLASLIFLLITEKSKEKKLIFVYMPACILVVFFIPLVAGVFDKYADSNTYFRLLMLLPVSITIAYSVTCLVSRVKAGMKIFAVAVAAILIVFGGKLVYSDVNFTKAENVYHVPDEVVDICDAIVVPGREVLAAFPTEMLTFVRQYSPYVCMPYGRDDLMNEDQVNYSVEFRELVDSENPEAERLGALANEAGCHYVIINEKHILQGNLEDYDFEEYAVIDGYVIYKSTTANFNLY